MKPDYTQISPIPPAPLQYPRKGGWQRREALRILGLPEELPRANKVSRVLKKIESELPDDESVMSILRSSTKPESALLVDLMDALGDRLQDHVDWDDLVAAVRLHKGQEKFDGGKLLGIVTEEVYRQWGTLTSVIASISSPKVMRARAVYATLPEGHSDAKMILQTTGVAPVPKNQVTNITVRDSHIGDNVQNNQNLTLEDVVGGNDDMLGGIEADADDLLALPAPVTKQDLQTIDAELDEIESVDNET